jgi:hypothetical protein
LVYHHESESLQGHLLDHHQYSVTVRTKCSIMKMMKHMIQRKELMHMLCLETLTCLMIKHLQLNSVKSASKMIQHIIQRKLKRTLDSSTRLQAV